MVEQSKDILASIIELFLQHSQCATENEQKEYLLQILGNKQLVTTLLLRASEHGWTAKDFHDRCDGKGPTISLFKIHDGDCIGGYTNVKWSSGEPYGMSYADNEAMLFNLTC